MGGIQLFDELIDAPLRAAVRRSPPAAEDGGIPVQRLAGVAGCPGAGRPIESCCKRAFFDRPAEFARRGGKDTDRRVPPRCPASAAGCQTPDD